MVERNGEVKDPVLKKFLEEVKKFSEEYPEEGDALHGEMLYWASAVVEANETLGAAVRAQIMAIARNQGKNGVENPDTIIENLFSKNPKGEISADIVMGRFQLWS